MGRGTGVLPFQQVPGVVAVLLVGTFDRGTELGLVGAGSVACSEHSQEAQDALALQTLRV